jgi:DNA-binding response OmpR family regulator
VCVTNRTVDTHMAQLRKKIEDDPGNPKFILGVRGVGYKLAI